VTETLVVEPRFNGPPGSGNGGYTCGLVAGLVGAEEVEVSLRSPPPLGRPLSVTRAAGGAVEVNDGDVRVAEGRPTELLEDVPDAVPREEIEAATRGGAARWCDHHPFPTCFVCGPARESGDGLRIFPVELPGREGLFGALWRPDASLAGDDDRVRPECVWAALDCPTSAPVANFGSGPPIVLARLSARLGCPVLVGEDHSILSWELGRSGRKREGAAALYDSRGRLLCASRALWIELQQQG
jgi:hypothetical protein